MASIYLNWAKDLSAFFNKVLLDCALPKILSKQQEKIQ
jgi:hypothetical protein